MIASDQPRIFQKRIIAALSSKGDGNMSLFNGSQAGVLDNRQSFLKKTGVNIAHTTFMQIQYAGMEHFSKYIIADQTHKNAKQSLAADAIIVTKPNHAIFLPLADCAGAVIYDTKKNILMVSHLGRHSTEEQGGTKSIEYLKRQFGCSSNDILVWISPAVGKDTYPLTKFEDDSLHAVLLKQFKEAGISENNIEICALDTAKNENYFSHSQHLAGNQPVNDRFAIVAMMTDELSLL